MKALILTADGFEDSGLLVPYYRLREEDVPVDNHLVTSRGPADLPAFMREVMKIVHRLRGERGQ